MGKANFYTSHLLLSRVYNEAPSRILRKSLLFFGNIKTYCWQKLCYPSVVGKIEVGCQQKCDQHVHERSRRVNMLFATCPQPPPATHTAIHHVGTSLHRSQGQMCRLHKYVFSRGKDINKKKGLPIWCLPVKQQLVGSVEDLKSNSLALVESPMRRAALCIQLL